MRLIAALSGGVDSAVAAALAIEQGHDVTGVTMKQWEFGDEATRLASGCNILDAVTDARRVCDVLGVAHYTLDLRDDFEREVVDPFVEEYAAGRTPNPCIRCNQRVRFGVFLERARRLGFDGVVTGHHARLVRDGERVRLLRSLDTAKDQSYVLYALDRAALRAAHFPLGDVRSKGDVRDRARELGLPNADRPDSVDVCFVGDDSRPGDVVAERAPAWVRSGPVLDRDGRQVGEHRGLAYYTVGQRRGLGPLDGGGHARYVATIDAARNAIVVDSRDALASGSLRAGEPRWIVDAPAPGERLDAVIRYGGEPTPCTYRPTPDGFDVTFDRPVRAVAPGQAVVLYDGDEVVGGGTIVSGG